MEYSIISILRSIESGIARFRTLKEPKFRRDEAGEMIYKVGNSALILNVWQDGRWCSLKCYTYTLSCRKEIYGDKLLEGEIFISVDANSGVWLDALLEEWIEGETLGESLRKAVDCGDSIADLSESFDRLALSLLEQDFAHGDLTTENIIVDCEGELHLIDFDSSYHPHLSATQSIELGTEAYQHPARTIDNFDHTLDDYSIALISTALTVLSLNPSLYARYQHGEGLIYNPAKIKNEPYIESLKLLSQAGEIFAYRIATLLRSPVPSLPELYPLMRLKVEGQHPDSQPTTPLLKAGLWGYLNPHNREVIPPLFDAALPFSDGAAAVQIGTSWHYIDHRCRLIKNCHQYEAIKSPRNHQARVRQNGVWLMLPLWEG